MDTAITYSVKLVTDLNSLNVMRFVGNKMGVQIKVAAKAGQKYSSRGGEGMSIVPPGYCHVVVDPKTDQIKDFWEKVSREKSKRKLIWDAAHPQ